MKKSEEYIIVAWLIFQTITVGLFLETKFSEIENWMKFFRIK